MNFESTHYTSNDPVNLGLEQLRDSSLDILENTHNSSTVNDSGRQLTSKPADELDSSKRLLNPSSFPYSSSFMTGERSSYPKSLTSSYTSSLNPAYTTNSSSSNFPRTFSSTYQHYPSLLRSPYYSGNRSYRSDNNLSIYPHITRPRESSDFVRNYQKRPLDSYYAQENSYYIGTINRHDQSEEESDNDTEFSESGYPEFDIDAFYNVPSILFSELDLQNPEKRERLEWHTMLSSVLKGDVMQSEKKRMSDTKHTGYNKQNINDIWLGLQAWLHGRLISDQAEVIRYNREKVEFVLKDVINFEVIPFEFCQKAAFEQVADLLGKVEECESYYISNREMGEDVPLYASKKFNDKLNALISWRNVKENVQTETVILQRWVGNESFDLTSQITNSPSFVERIFRQFGLQKTFEQRTLTTLNRLIHQAKQTIEENAKLFEEMKLPTYGAELRALVDFPIKLVDEALRIRLMYAKKVKGSNSFMVDSLLDDFKVALSVAVRVKLEYIDIASPRLGWDLPQDVDACFNDILLESLKFYFRLLATKLNSCNKSLYFKEIDFLENEWAFLDNYVGWIDGGIYEMASHFGYLLNRLLMNVHRHLEAHLKGPEERSTMSLTNWFTTLLKNTQVRFRKILRFFDVYNSRLQNSAEYIVHDSCLNEMVDRLSSTGHFLTYTATLERDGVFIIADASLLEAPEAIKSLAVSATNNDLEFTKKNKSYVLILSTKQPFLWKGRIINVDIPDFPVDLKNNHIRIVTSNDASHLQDAKAVFQDLNTGLVSLRINCRSNIARVYKEYIRFNKLCIRIASTVLDSVNSIREACKGLECSELIYSAFAFAAEFSQRGMRFINFDSLDNHLQKKTMNFAIDWVAFLSEECDPLDRKTFRWAVGALEFLMVVLHGTNILMLEDPSFERLRDKVGKTMSLLLNHFDILGAKSKTTDFHELEVGNMNDSSRRYLNYGNVEEDETITVLQKEMMQRIEEIDAARNAKLHERLAIGHVLDVSVYRNRDFIKLASSLSNITIRWQQGQFVKSGMFGDVYSGVNLDTGDLLAVKEIKILDSRSLKSTVDQIHNEMTVLEKLNHPNIVSYYGVEVHREKVYIFMELCQGGSLADLLSHGRIEDEAVVGTYVLQLLEALCYMHSRNVLHRDIKPGNLLLDRNGNIKFSDFGSALYVPPPEESTARLEDIQLEMHSLAGTPMYTAPEIIVGTKKGRFGSMDIWGLGCVVLEMLAGCTPWNQMDNEWAIMYHIAVMHTPTIPSSYQITSLARDFLERCFECDPEKRPTALELYLHPWVTKLREKIRVEIPVEMQELINTHNELALEDERKKKLNEILHAENDENMKTVENDIPSMPPYSLNDVIDGLDVVKLEDERQRSPFSDTESAF
ncbi:STE/STE11 protein kinase Wis4 [Schizosaccharomyces octosporus yFS286]|uniref:STE/STE11 protein kinase Wis4 n=1 Tax=Schizosaccharomyces octosporus (strain yFS286) TaxID=483514 RepID=S9PXA0_SCHOY|nr:STE/STE11 protein kinase Wis4 [Schizosaccharomyces octosporus yFS286]EPX72592.1 STE/STE11 protein kinase Wis4 [Schizosaccharomyces octosporus yFS286]